MDSRAFVKIKFVIYGSTYEEELSINWYPESNNSMCDSRITKWFADCYENAVCIHQANMKEQEIKRIKRTCENCGKDCDALFWQTASPLPITKKQAWNGVMPSGDRLIKVCSSCNERPHFFDPGTGQIIPSVFDKIEKEDCAMCGGPYEYCQICGRKN